MAQYIILFIGFIALIFLNVKSKPTNGPLDKDTFNNLFK